MTTRRTTGSVAIHRRVIVFGFLLLVLKLPTRADEIKQPNPPTRISPASPFSTLLQRKRSSTAFAEILLTADEHVRKTIRTLGMENVETADQRLLLAMLHSRAGNGERAFQLTADNFRTAVKHFGVLDDRVAAFASHLSEFAYQTGRTEIRRHAARIAFSRRREIAAAAGRLKSHVESVNRQTGRYGTRSEHFVEHWLFASVRLHTHVKSAPAEAWFNVTKEYEAIEKANKHSGVNKSMQKAVQAWMQASTARKVRYERIYGFNESEFLIDLAHLLAKLNYHEDAGRIFKSARELCLKTNNRNSLEYADVCNVAGKIFRLAGDIPTALEWFTNSESILQTTAPDTLALGIARKDLAVCLLQQSDNSTHRARELLKSAVQLMTGRVEQRNNEFQEAMVSLAFCHLHADDKTKALQLLEKVNQPYLDSTLTLGDLSNHQDLVARTSPAGNGTIALASKFDPSPEFRRELFQIHVSQKGAFARSLASGASNTSNVIDRLDFGSVAGLVGRMMSSGDLYTDDRAETWEYAFRRHGLLHQPSSVTMANAARERHASFGIPGMKKLNRNRWALAKVQENLAHNEVYIDFVRYADRWRQTTEYAAWVVTKVSAEFVDIGTAALIEKEIDQLASEILEAPSRILDIGHSGACKSWKRIAGSLSRRLLTNHLARLSSTIDTIIISPDAALWNIPWCALLTESSEFVVEKYQTSLVTEPQGMTIRRQFINFSGDNAVFHSPSFDCDPRMPVAAARATTMLTGDSDFSNTYLPGPVVDLPGSKREAAGVKTTLRAISGRDPSTFVGDFASEFSFNALKSPSVILFSTHAFFIPDRFLETTYGYRVNRENPLTRCGLMLAGCNARKDDFGGGKFLTKTPEPEKRYPRTYRDELLLPAGKRRSIGGFPMPILPGDGILTGLEVVRNTGLANTELVVLSACETGVGEFGASGESMSLSLAFHAAGVRSVLAAIWRIPDEESADLIESFFSSLGKTRLTDKALASAQRSTIEKLRKKHRAAHPYFWAAFSLTHANLRNASAKETLPKHGRTSRKVLPKFVKIPSGSFTMGSRRTPKEITELFPYEKPATFENEHPLTNVKITKPFEISATEITVGQFRQFVNETGYVTEAEKTKTRVDLQITSFQPGEQLTWKSPGNGSESDDDPVTVVTWNDAQSYCHWLSRKVGAKIRLPSQAEWEYSCRAGSQTMYWHGDAPEGLTKVANVPNHTRLPRVDTIGYPSANNPVLSYYIPPQVGQFELRPTTSFAGNSQQSYPAFRVKNLCKKPIKLRCDNHYFLLAEGADVAMAPDSTPLPETGMVEVFDTETNEWQELYAPLGSYIETQGTQRKPMFTHIVNQELAQQSKFAILHKDTQVRKFRALGKETEIAPGEWKVIEAKPLANSFAADSDDGFKWVAEVGQFPANKFGLHDMHGNVWEWCEDGEYDYESLNGSAIDPFGPDIEVRILRGGCYT